MNKAIQQARAEGYQSTGNVAREWEREKLLPRVDEYKVMGNKVKILREVEINNFRDRSDKSVYWVIYVKYSAEYLAHQKAELEARRKLNAENALRRLADGMTIEEIAFMMTSKTNMEKSLMCMTLIWIPLIMWQMMLPR